MRLIHILLLLLSPIYLYGQRKEISLLFVGDLMQHQAQIEAALCNDGSYDYGHCFSLVKERISRADFAIGNLEVTLGGKPYRGYPQFSAPDEFLYAIKDAGFDILATANNHSLDRHHRGLERTLTLIDSAGLEAIGTYHNADDRTHRYPLIIEKNGIRIALLCATYGTNGIATRPPNIVNRLNREELSEDIRTARRMKADAIIAIVHWGNEYQQQPTEEQRNLAHWLISQGVDHIIGSHPHVIQPVELIPHTDYPTHHAVIYSLGNYISNMSIAHSTVGLTVELTIEKIGPTTRLKHFDHQLVWTERATLSKTKNFRIIPEDTIPSDLTSDAQQHMQRAIDTKRMFLKSILHK